MTFVLEHGIQVLTRTPPVLRELLADLPTELTATNEGGDSFSPFDVVAHLIGGEQTDWIPRARIILNREPRAFDPFDRFGAIQANGRRPLGELLDRFESLRARNLETLREFNLTELMLELTGTHPELGLVTPRQLLATWVVHDLGHIGQIVRVMSKQYDRDVGPWKQYLPVLTR